MIPSLFGSQLQHSGLIVSENGGGAELYSDRKVQKTKKWHKKSDLDFWILSDIFERTEWDEGFESQKSKPQGSQEQTVYDRNHRFGWMKENNVFPALGNIKTLCLRKGEKKSEEKRKLRCYVSEKEYRTESKLVWRLKSKRTHAHFPHGNSKEKPNLMEKPLVQDSKRCVGQKWVMPQEIEILNLLIHWFLFSFFSLSATHTGCGIKVPQPGTEPWPPAVEARSPNYWITREVPDVSLKSKLTVQDWSCAAHSEEPNPLCIVASSCVAQHQCLSSGQQDGGKDRERAKGINRLFPKKGLWEAPAYFHHMHVTRS